MVFLQKMKSKIYILALVVTLILACPGWGYGESAEEHFQKGHRFYLELKPTEAEREFQEALKLDPSLSDAHYYLGSIYFKQDRFTEAIEQCKQALGINPEDIKSLIILGLSFQHMGMYDEAVNTYLKAQRFDAQSATIHSALGLAYCAKGELAKAKKECSILEKLDSELADDLLQRINEIENAQAGGNSK